MIKKDEVCLFAKLKEQVLKAGPSRHVDARHVAEQIGIPEKRLQYILEKWTDKGWWDYGVSACTGWFTEAGFALESLEHVDIPLLKGPEDLVRADGTVPIDPGYLIPSGFDGTGKQ